MAEVEGEVWVWGWGTGGVWRRRKGLGLAEDCTAADGGVGRMEKRWKLRGRGGGMQGWECGWRRMRGEGQSFGISRARWVQACARVLDPRGILSVCPAPDQASWPREFVWPVGWGVWTQGLTLCSALSPILSMCPQLYTLQPCS